MESVPLAPDLAASHLDLCPADLRFREVAVQDSELSRRATFAEMFGRNSMLRYRPQFWPTFIGGRKVEELAGISIALSSLIRSVPERVFGNDAGRIARYYGLDENYVRLLLVPPNGIAGALSRGDLLHTRDGFQCVEFNMTSNLGGWETSILAGMVSRVPAVQRFLRDHDLRFTFRNTLRLLFQHAAREALGTQARGGREVNLAIGSLEAPGVVNEAARRFLASEYREALAALDPSLTGTLAVTRYDEISEEKEILRLRDGRRLHGLIEWHTGRTDRLVFRSFKLGQLTLFNGPAERILSDKRNLAILSEHAESDLFDAAERTLIQRHIPWTRLVLPGTVLRQGERISLKEHVLSHREGLVLKRARSLGGEHVMLGRFTPPEEWSAALQSALGSGDWVVQDHVESLPYLFQNGEDGCSPHDVVWGPFVFGTTYAGTILRVQPKTLEGIVNLTRGASEGILLEVESSEALPAVRPGRS
jgi:hypothetical protein